MLFLGGFIVGVVINIMLFNVSKSSSVECSEVVLVINLISGGFNKMLL